MATARRPGWRGIVGRIALALAALTLVLIPAEFLLRVRAASVPYRIQAASVRAQFNPAPGVMPGVQGPSIYSTTAEGVRGGTYHPEGRFNVLAVGGSTTENLYMDDSEAWPALLETGLNEDRRGAPVWIGNVGASGHGVVQHILAGRYYLPQLRIDCVLVLVGVNDLSPALRRPFRAPAVDPNNFDAFLDETFRTRPLIDPRIERSFPANLALWGAAHRAYWVVRRWWKSQLTDGAILVEDQVGLSYAKRREIVRRAPLTDELPDFRLPLAAYRRNLVELVDTVLAQGVDIVLVTQPSLWYASLSAKAEKLLWYGYVGTKSKPRARYTAAALERALEMFNAVTLDVCRERGVPCIDLAVLMADDRREAYYWDDMHFTEEGSIRVAELLVEQLRPIFEKRDGGDAGPGT